MHQLGKLGRKLIELIFVKINLFQIGESANLRAQKLQFVGIEVQSVEERK